MAQTFAITRSLEMKAPAAKIFPFLNDFHAWGQWSPWEKMDPDMTKEFTGAAMGVGAKYAWVGKKTGSGSMEMLEVQEPGLLKIALRFTKPFKAENETVLTLEERGDVTNVTWLMTGKQPLLMQALSLFINQDKMIGKDFEAGLNNLQAIVEA